MIPYFFFGLFDGAGEVVEQAKQSLEVIHGWIRDKKQTKEELEAERIKLGIIEAKKEVKSVVKLIKKAAKESPKELPSLYTHESLARYRLEQAQQAYDALLFRINSNALEEKLKRSKALNDAIEQQAIIIAQQEIERERIKRQQAEENDIVYLMSMLASM